MPTSNYNNNNNTLVMQGNCLCVVICNYLARGTKLWFPQVRTPAVRMSHAVRPEAFRSTDRC